MSDGPPRLPEESAAQQRAAHFAALRAIAEAASLRLKTAGDTAAEVAQARVGLTPADPEFFEMIARAHIVEEAIDEALRDHQAAWTAFLDAVTADDQSGSPTPR